MTDSVLLIDLSAVFWAAWHSSANDEISAARERTLNKIRSLARDEQFVAVCCDTGRSFRYDIYADYKANRPPKDKAAIDELRQTRERLEADGMLLWGCEGFEADDVIATACREAVHRGLNVTIATADKDLLQLVFGDTVTVLSTITGERRNEAGVVEKFGIPPSMFRDYLALVGDPSDNIPGVDKVGAKTAANLLRKYGPIEKIYEAACSEEKDLEFLTPAVRGNIVNGGAVMGISRELVTLKDGAPIIFDAIFQARETKALTDSEIATLRRAHESIENDLVREEHQVLAPALAEEAEPPPGGAGLMRAPKVSVVRHQPASRTVETIISTMRDLKVIRTFIATQLHDGLDFGLIPGTGAKKTLFLPGAQKTNAFFNVRPAYDIQRFELPAGHVEYVITCRLISRDGGEEVSSGVGSCSSMETKYRYRSGEAVLTDKPVPREYWNEKDAKYLGGKGFTAKKTDKGWFIAVKSGEKEENKDIHDVRNTVLKMGKKRAYVDATIALGCMSEIFTQDFGELFDIDGENQ